MLDVKTGKDAALERAIADAVVENLLYCELPRTCCTSVLRVALPPPSTRTLHFPLPQRAISLSAPMVAASHARAHYTSTVRLPRTALQQSGKPPLDFFGGFHMHVACPRTAPRPTTGLSPLVSRPLRPPATSSVSVQESSTPPTMRPSH